MNTPRIRARFIATDAMLPQLEKTYGPSLYYRAIIPKGTYQQDTDVPVVGVAVLLVVSETMPEDLAHDITRVLFDKQPELAIIHPQAKVLSIEDGDDGLADSVPSRRDPLLPRPAGVDELEHRLAVSGVTSVLAFALAAYALYWAVGIRRDAPLSHQLPAAGAASSRS